MDGNEGIVTLLADWSPGIGDPTPMGWVTVGVYALAAVLCWRRAWQSRRLALPRSETALWLCVALLLSFLCINKQLDLQTLMTETAKRLAKAQGWYEGRRTVQGLFIVAVALAGAGAMGLVLHALRGRLKRHALLLGGMMFLLTFIIIRAASFHHVDHFLRFEVGGIVRVNWILELAGLAMMIVGAVSRGRSARAFALTRPAHPRS